MNSSGINISLTRLREYERGHARNYFVVFEIALFALIIGMLMITLGAGVGVYRNISETRWADEQNRTGLTLIANSVHITDTIDAIGVGAGPEGQSLVLTELFSTGAYETRIYLHQGNIVEEYAVAGSPYTPERATPLVESDVFSFSYANNLLSVNTTHGTEQIMLHSVRKAGTGNAATEELPAESTGAAPEAATAAEDEAAEAEEDELIEAGTADASASEGGEGDAA